MVWVHILLLNLLLTLNLFFDFKLPVIKVRYQDICAQFLCGTNDALRSDLVLFKVHLVNFAGELLILLLQSEIFFILFIDFDIIIDLELLLGQALVLNWNQIEFGRRILLGNWDRFEKSGALFGRKLVLTENLDDLCNCCEYFSLFDQWIIKQFLVP